MQYIGVNGNTNILHSFIYIHFCQSLFFNPKISCEIWSYSTDCHTAANPD